MVDLPAAFAMLQHFATYRNDIAQPSRRIIPRAGQKKNKFHNCKCKPFVLPLRYKDKTREF